MDGPATPLVPPAPLWLRMVGVGREDASPRSAAVTAAIIVLAAVTVRPVGTHGTALAALVLLVVNCALLATRVIPARFVDERLRLVLLWSGVIASAALVALGRDGATTVFGFFVAGHAGFRLASERSVPIALACSLGNGGSLLFGWGVAHRTTPWEVGALSGLAVLLGMVSRGREQLLRSAMMAAESADRAARAEARETIMAERGRVARDVHDVLAHSLAGISMQLNLANALLDKGDVEQARRITGQAQDQVRDSLVEAQRTVQALREDSLPLVATLRSMAGSALPPAAFALRGTERQVAGSVAQPLVRVAQEALTNAHRHATGAGVRMTLSFSAGLIGLDVVNSRADPTVPRVLSGSGGGLGLVGMRERVEAIGGHVNSGPVTAGPDAGGWLVRAEVPT